MEKSATAKKVIDGLKILLADTYLLYLKTQNFHWNVTGPHFISLHTMLEEQYDQLSAAADLLAERIRALKIQAPGSFTEFLKLTSLKEASGETSSTAMISTLLKDHESMSATISGLFKIMEDAGDEATLDILIQRQQEHEKTAWMLRSTLEG
jgi:starvation-inducible DNA-binding protein